jgi:predicted nucleic acid-binding protein
MEMKLYLPDTNILIYSLAGKKPYKEYFEEWVMQKTLALSSIVVAELLSGASEKEEGVFSAVLDKFGSLPIDTAVVRIAASYRKKYLRKNYHLRLPNCLIAATAKLYGATFVTSDLKDFPMKDIQKLRL